MRFNVPNVVAQSKKFLLLLDSTTDIISLQNLHAQLVIRGVAKTLRSQTKLLSQYGALGDASRARKLFDRIPHPDFYSWKVMLRWYTMNDLYSEAIRFSVDMRCCVRDYDNVVCSLVLKACAKLVDIESGMKLHCYITKVGNPDCFLLNILIDMYAKCGVMEYARRVFDDVSEPNVVSWTSVISGYAQNDCPEEGLVLFNQMRYAAIEPSEYTIVSLLTACSALEDLHQGRWIHGYVIKHGIRLNSVMGTALLDVYVKCGAVTDACSIFDGLSVGDLVSWTAMIVGYTQKGLPIEALKLFCDEKWCSVVPNSVTLASVLSASAQMRDLALGRSIHMLGIKLGLESYAIVMNALVDMYAKCSSIAEAACIFERISDKDVVTWNAMIAGFSQNESGYEALLLFNQMKSEGCSPDAITVVGALSACACLGDVNNCSSFHGYAIKLAFLSNVYVSTALLNMYNKCGDVLSARRVFDMVSNGNAVTWSAMMGGYGMHGDSFGSLDLFGEMLRKDLRPNDITFTSVLSACSHSGMVEEGLKYFDSMIEQYNIVPLMKHYTCMVDMLARAGKLEEALAFITRMPMQADVSVWGALLHGSGIHSRLDLGEVAVRKLIELQPETPDYYVLMCNLYTSVGKWDESDKIREMMKERGLIKLPGSSFVPMEAELNMIS